MSDPVASQMSALLGPTNTGKTYRAVERMLEHPTGMIGLPLRLLAREVYDRVTAKLGERRVALVTGEEKRVPAHPHYWVCTVESMPTGLEVDFLAVDEIQLCAHRQRGHTFTDRMLRARGRCETWFLGAETVRPLVEELLPTCAIRRHPRFSRLSYTGAHGLGALPPRTAVVAFSVADVYEIAERMRSRHGGTAVVLGALSPRTRNAQVAMYEAGEVHYMVATDAIGMGLNLDVDRVVFASLHKFDGSEIRPLGSAELGQIAGRAGRYTRDGGFGTLRPLPGLEQRVVRAIETHRFRPLRRAVWRSAELDFSSVDALIASLRTRPRRACVRLVERADDFEALVQLARQDDVRARASGPEAVELLWDVCRIPDFRKLLLDSHVQLLAAVYDQLSGPRPRIDVDWMAKRIARLSDTDGDIETLMNRIAFIRTWTYITNHERWVVDAEHWRAVTREVEDRQSDALHARLTDRFVEREASGPIRATGRRRRVPSSAPPPCDPDHPFSTLLDLELPGAPEPEDVDVAWVQSLTEAVHEAFRLERDGRIALGDRVVGRLGRGSDVLHPEVSVLGGDDLGAGARRRIARRLVAWTQDAVGDLVGHLDDVDDRLSAAGRGLVYQLRRGLGTVDPRRARAQLQDLTEDDRQRLTDAGVEVGNAAVYLPGSLRPHATALRSALWVAHFEPELAPNPPAAGAVSMPVDRDVAREYYPHVGYLVRGPRAIRADQLQRAETELRDRDTESGAELPPQLSAWLGCRRRQLAAVLRAMGYRRKAGGRWSRQRSGA